MAENGVYGFLIDYLDMKRASGSLSMLMDTEEQKAWVMEFNSFKQSL